MLVNHNSSIIYNNKSYDYENNNKYVQKPKNSWSHLNHRLFPENLIYDLLNVLAKPMGTIVFR